MNGRAKTPREWWHEAYEAARLARRRSLQSWNMARAERRQAEGKQVFRATFYGQAVLGYVEYTWAWSDMGAPQVDAYHEYYGADTPVGARLGGRIARGLLLAMAWGDGRAVRLAQPRAIGLGWSRCYRAWRGKQWKW